MADLQREVLVEFVRFAERPQRVHQQVNKIKADPTFNRENNQKYRVFPPIG